MTIDQVKDKWEVLYVPVPKDLLGRVIQIGDVIAHPLTSGRSAQLAVYRVEKINPPKLKDYWPHYSLTVTPILRAFSEWSSPRKKRSLSVFDRCIVLHKDTLGEVLKIEEQDLSFQTEDS